MPPALGSVCNICRISDCWSSPVSLRLPPSKLPSLREASRIALPSSESAPTDGRDWSRRSSAIEILIIAASRVPICFSGVDIGAAIGGVSGDESAGDGGVGTGAFALRSPFINSINLSAGTLMCDLLYLITNQVKWEAYRPPPAGRFRNLLRSDYFRPLRPRRAMTISWLRGHLRRASSHTHQTL